jgi:hypothetical protein
MRNFSRSSCFQNRIYVYDFPTWSICVQFFYKAKKLIQNYLLFKLYTVLHQTYIAQNQNKYGVENFRNNYLMQRRIHRRPLDCNCGATWRHVAPRVAVCRHMAPYAAAWRHVAPRAPFVISKNLKKFLFFFICFFTFNLLSFNAYLNP